MKGSGVLAILTGSAAIVVAVAAGPCARITDVRDDMRDDMRVIGTKVDRLHEELDTKADSKDIRALGSQLDRLSGQIDVVLDTVKALP